MGAIDAALNTIDAIAAEGDLAPAALTAERLDLESAGEPIVLPDGKRIYPPLLHGEPVDRIACDLLDMDDPAALDVPAADRPARGGQEPDRARDRAPPVDRARSRGRGASRRPVLRVRGDAAGPVLGRVLLPLRLRPGRRRRRPGRARGLGVRGGDARGLGGDDRRGQHRPRRLPAVDQRHPRRAPCPLPRRHRRDRDRAARVRGAARLQPRAWSAPPTSPTPGTRAFPATLEVASNWAALAQLGAPEPLVAEAMRLDRQRTAGEDGLTWTPQFRDIEALWRMIDRVGERAGARVLRLQPARASPGRQGPGRRGGRRLPDARPGRLRAPEGRRPPAGGRTCTATRGR